MALSIYIYYSFLFITSHTNSLIRDEKPNRNDNNSVLAYYSNPSVKYDTTEILVKMALDIYIHNSFLFIASHQFIYEGGKTKQEQYVCSRILFYARSKICLTLC